MTDLVHHIFGQIWSHADWTMYQRLFWMFLWRDANHGREVLWQEAMQRRHPRSVCCSSILNLRQESTKLPASGLHLHQRFIIWMDSSSIPILWYWCDLSSFLGPLVKLIRSVMGYGTGQHQLIQSPAIVRNLHLWPSHIPTPNAFNHLYLLLMNLASLTLAQSLRIFYAALSR